jgi:hypothetical protein
MQSSSSPRYKQIVVVGVGEPERDDDVEIPSSVLGGVIASSSPEGRVDEGHMSDGVWLLGSMPSEPVPSEL